MNSKSDFIPTKLFGDNNGCTFSSLMKTKLWLHCIIVGAFFLDSGDNKSNAFVQQESKNTT